MELIYIVAFILLVIILTKLSNVESKLEKIEKMLRSTNTDNIPVTQPAVNSVETVKKEPKKEEKREIPLKVESLNKKINEIRTQISEQESSTHNQTKATEELVKNDKILETKKVVETKEITAKEVVKKEQKTPEQTTQIEDFFARFDNISFEELLFGNIILKVAIVAFILGIGLFLKYSIDKDWIPIWGRILIGIMVGIALLVGGIKMIDNKHKLFSEGLFGGGIAVLYLSIFAAFALEGFQFIDSNLAFVAMILITILAGVISIRFDAKSTAVFGLIGGFATPFLLSTGSGNYVGLLSYMLMLNLGVLYISIYKKWSLLTWMAFVITALTQVAVVAQTSNDFTTLLLLFIAFFVIYSVVPFIADIKAKKEQLAPSSVFLFILNFVVVIVSLLILFTHYNIELFYYAGVTVGLATYLLAYAALLTRNNAGLKNLFYIVLAQAIALLLLTPAFIFEGASLTIFWAIESLMLLFIATKINEKVYALFAFLGFIITIIRYLRLDLFEYLSTGYVFEKSAILSYVQHLSVVSFFVIGSLFVAYRLLKKSNLELEYIDNNDAKTGLFMLSFFGTFAVINYITSMLFNFYNINIFAIISMLTIALFVFLLNKSDYQERGTFVYYFFISILGLWFINNIFSINNENTLVALFNFMVFGGVSAFIYQLKFKDLTLKGSKYQPANIMLFAGVSILFLFLNVEIYHVVKFYDETATKFAITLLWVTFGISLFVYGVLKEIRIPKTVGTALILIAILKAFFVDLAKLDSIYRIVLFLILGAILFGLSYFYQNKQESRKEIQEKKEEK